MQVLDLECRQAHVFEGWFGSEEEFQGQLERGLVECPVCGDTHIAKRLSAPRINLGAQPPKAPSAKNEVMATSDPAMQAQWLQMVRHVMANTEDVGERFAEEARRIHYGESPQRGIRGQATPEERQALSDEGIETVAIPVPRALDGPVQ